MIMANDRHSYVEFYPSDWLAGVGFMPPLAEWLYLQVCLYNWDKAEALPAAEIPLRFARHTGWEADLAMLVSAGKITKTQGGGLFVSRALAQARKALDLWEKKSRGGKNGKRGKYQSLSDDENNTPINTHQSNQNQNQNQIDEGEPSPMRVPAPARDAHAREGADPDEGANGDLVFSVPAEAWREFRNHRDRLKAPMTQRAETLILKKLETFHAKGHDPTEVLEQSMTRGWRDVFELKDERNGRFGGNGSGGRPQRGSTGDGFVDAGLEAIAKRRERGGA